MKCQFCGKELAEDEVCSNCFLDDEDDDWWMEDYACENYCCICCGCSCYYYDDEFETMDCGCYVADGCDCPPTNNEEA